MRDLTYRILFTTLIIVFLSPTVSLSQTYPIAEDVNTIEGIMKAYYEVVSGPAGEPRQWERDRSLHHPDAQIIIIGTDADGNITPNVQTLAEFHERSGNLSTSGFFEYEISRVVSRHGANAHVWSTYEWRSEKEGPVGGQGVNSIQLYHDGNRWWITGWTFDGRNNAPPVPEAYLPKQ